jgi:acyl carrier protein
MAGHRSGGTNPAFPKRMPVHIMESTEVRKDKIIDILYLAIEEINQGLPVEARLDKSLQTPLVGAEGKLDSLGFVNLIVSAEEKLSAEFGPISLAEAIVANDEINPPQTVEALADLVGVLLEGKTHE